MPYTEAQIANMALGHVGIKGLITSLDSLDDTTNEAVACRLFYAHARDMILTMQPWPFAKVRQNLQLSGTAWDGWTYSYTYPANCSFLEKIVLPGLRTEPADRKVPFIVVRNPDAPGKLVMTDQESAVAQFNLKVTDPSEFDPTFAHAVSLLLATLICTPLRVSADMTKNVNQLYTAWQAEASTKVMRESREDPVPDSEFVTGRN